MIPTARIAQGDKTSGMRWSSTDQGARIGPRSVKSESLDKGSRMRRTPEQSPVSTPEGPREWDDPTTVDVVGDVQFIGLALLGRDHAGG
jgi:hypothetical protein